MTDRWSKIIKNPKIKNTPSILKRFKSIKKSTFPKKWKFWIFWWFWRPLSKGIRCESLFEKPLLAGNRWHEIWKSSCFFVRWPWITIPDHTKKTKLKKNFQNFCHAILPWKQSEKNSKKQKSPKSNRIKGKIDGQKRWKLFKKRLGNHHKCSVALKTGDKNF